MPNIPKNMDSNRAVSKWYPFLWRREQFAWNYSKCVWSLSQRELLLNTHVHLHGISPRKLEFFVSLQTIPSAAMHHTLATLFLVQPSGCCVFGSMWSRSGSGHMNWPMRNWPQSTSAATISYNSFDKIKTIIANIYLIVVLLLPFPTNQMYFVCTNTFLSGLSNFSLF